MLFYRAFPLPVYDRLPAEGRSWKSSALLSRQARHQEDCRAAEIVGEDLDKATTRPVSDFHNAITKLTTEAGRSKFKPMTINVRPETEQLVQEEIQNGHFRSVDEIIVEGVQAWRERHRSKQIGLEASGASRSRWRTHLPLPRTRRFLWAVFQSRN